jgi:hypothetical protein
MNPIKPMNFQLAEHRYRRFDCIVPADTDKKDLENPALWVNVAPQLRMFDEVRVISDDHSFMAKLLVTFTQGTDARLKLLYGVDLEGESDIEDAPLKYDIKMKGQLKWCIVNNETGETIKTNISKKSEAQRELEEYIAALHR